MRTHPPSHGLSRRQFLRAAGALGCLAGLPAWSAPVQDWPQPLFDYLASLARPDGGYGWPEQDRSHLTATWAVVGCHQLFQRPLPRPEALAVCVRASHPQQGRKPEYALQQFDFQQVQTLRWLGDKAEDFHARFQAWTRPVDYPRQYESGGNPPLPQTVSAVLGRALLGLPLADATPAYGPYLAQRCRANGSFNHLPAAEGGDGHAVVTWWALQAGQALGQEVRQPQALMDWLRQCQLPNGGFTWQPKPALAGMEDVTYTWAAVHSLQLLGSQPRDVDACRRHLWSLWHPTGGFSDRPGWQPNPVATYYALSALAILAALTPPAPLVRQTAPPPPELPANLRAWSLQLEAPGQGSPAEVVDLARHLRIHLWGTKNATPAWVAECQKQAEAQKVPTRFFIANEEYGTFFTLPGLGRYSHISDIFAPGGADPGTTLAAQKNLTWEQFRAQRLPALDRVGGRVFWQFGENEEFVRLLLDDSLARGGYSAISTFHFGNPDFTTSQPFLLRYRQQIPFVALQDAHGGEAWWWSDRLAGFRTVFLAPEPTWDHWLEALRLNRVMAIRHDPVSSGQTWMHGGAPGVRERVISLSADWQWWGERPEENRRPLLSLVALRPGDIFEAERPARGVTLRVRCAWQTTNLGAPKDPLAELVSLAVDGRGILSGEAVARSLTAPRNNRGVRTDASHLWPLPDLAPGRHTAIAVARELASGRELRREVQFEG